MDSKFYNFRAVVLPQTLEKMLVDFLKQKQDDRTEKEKLFSAAFAFWLPFAAKRMNSCSEAQVHAYARSSINRLREQISYIADTFGLESEVAATVMPFLAPNVTAARQESPYPEPEEEEEELSMEEQMMRLAINREEDTFIFPQ